MQEAIAIARKAKVTGDVPVGALVINKDGVVIGNPEDAKKLKRVVRCAFLIK